jgi:hypothetical protein
VSRGEPLLEPGAATLRAFFVTRGSLDIMRPSHEGDVVATVRRGQFTGEASLLTGRRGRRDFDLEGPGCYAPDRASSAWSISREVLYRCGVSRTAPSRSAESMPAAASDACTAAVSRPARGRTTTTTGVERCGPVAG